MWNNASSVESLPLAPNADLFNKTFEHVSDRVALEGKLEFLRSQNKPKRQVPFNIAITTFVRQTGQVCMSFFWSSCVCMKRCDLLQ